MGIREVIERAGGVTKIRICKLWFTVCKGVVMLSSPYNKLYSLSLR